MPGFIPFISGFSHLNFKPLRGYVSKDTAYWIRLSVSIILLFIFLAFIPSLAMHYWAMHEDDAGVDADQVRELVATPEEVELAHTVVGEGCDGTNCFVYIADPSSMSADHHDRTSDRGPFLRMITSKGDDLSFGISEGRVFDATRMLACKPETKCGIAPIEIGDGTFELVVYDAPRREHTSYIQPGLRFALTAEEAQKVER
ncbi:hypothetical protein KKH24_02825 [Patescibacteria group bacterium]|nr:hypothetical protein [Patescibacteria group bacterium]